MTREEEYLVEKDLFRRNAFLVIKEMVVMLKEGKGHRSELVDEILHSIFFLGKINAPRYTPEYIVSDDDMLNALKGRFPQPFVKYSKDLPRRSPISCVLDMIVYLTGQENEKEIKERLQTLTLELKKDEATDLVSNTICVSQRDKTAKSVRYYGVSMSTSGCDPGRIIVAASCLSIWDSYVADAVMTYYPSKVKKTYFDGTIKLPKQVRCEAFKIRDGEHMDPCRSCGNLFGLTTSATQVWPYGNCAEPESVSNLLKNEKEVRDQAKPTSPTWTDANRKRAKEIVLKELKRCLDKADFNWDNDFYTPQA
ncbi:uncharacterized protein ABDE67_016234 [Symphorus nematophorus]